MQVCRLSYLQLLDLSKNSLSDNIPKCVGNLTAMVMKGSGDDLANHFYSSYAVTVFKKKRASSSSCHIWSRCLMSGGKKSLYNVGRTKRARRQLVSNSISYSSLKKQVSGEALIEALGEAIFTDIALVAWKGKVREFGRSGLELLKSIDLSNNFFSGILPTEITRLVELVSLNISCKLRGEVPKDIGTLKSLNSLDLSGNDFSGSIPWSLSWVDSLGYLDLSNNNFSGKIPSTPKLQTFNSSSYSGNPLLCGLPLPQKCGPDTGTIDGKVDDEEDESEVSKSYYMGMGVGFAVGFWGISGAIFLNRRCRHLLFASLSHINDWIYITMAVYLRKFKRF